MDQIPSLIDSLKEKRLFQIGVFLLLLIAIPLTLYLVRHQQIFKSRANPISEITFSGSGVNNTTFPPKTTNQTVTLTLTYGTGSAPSPTPTPTTPPTNPYAAGGGATPIPTTRPAATPTSAPGYCGGTCTYGACTAPGYTCGGSGTRSCTQSGSGCITRISYETCQLPACPTTRPTSAPTATPRPAATATPIPAICGAYNAGCTPTATTGQFKCCTGLRCTADPRASYGYLCK